MSRFKNRELLISTVCGSEFQTRDAENRKAHSFCTSEIHAQMKILFTPYIHCGSKKTRQLWRTITTTQFSRF